MYGVAAVVLWSTVAAAFKLSLKVLDPAQLLLFATIASICVLAIVLAFQRKLSELRRTTSRQLVRSLWLGFLNPFLYYVVLFNAYNLLPAQIAQPLNITWAFTLAILSVPLLGHRITRMDVVGGLICYGGVVVISTRGSFAGLGDFDPLGIALALGSTVIWALYWIGTTRDDREPAVALFMNFVCGLPYVVIYCWLFSEISMPGRRAMLGASYIGAFEMGVTFVLWLTAMRLAPSAARISTLIFLSPFLSLIFIHFLLGERIYASTFGGLVLIVGGLVMQQRKSGEVNP
jgi:drug/metabolite transporter (DMT)-like permease